MYALQNCTLCDPAASKGDTCCHNVRLHSVIYLRPVAARWCKLAHIKFFLVTKRRGQPRRSQPPWTRGSYKKSGAQAKGHPLSVSLLLSPSWPPSALTHVHLLFSSHRNWLALIYCEYAISLTASGHIKRLGWDKTNTMKTVCFIIPGTHCIVFLAWKTPPMWLSSKIKQAVLWKFDWRCGCLSFRLCIHHIAEKLKMGRVDVFFFNLGRNMRPGYPVFLKTHWYTVYTNIL